MVLSLKSTVSILALTVVLSTQNAFSMDVENDNTSVNKKSSKIEELPLKRPVTVVKDKFNDSGSKTFGKKPAQVMSAEGEPLRILGLDGGGVRGLFTAVELSILEEIINHPINQGHKKSVIEKIKLRDPEDYTKRLKTWGEDLPIYIRDLFDIGTGTSTGSILTAGLFCKEDLSAMDLAKIYARYGYKIFDEQKRTVAPVVGIGLTYATYSNDGLRTILADYFINNKLQDVYKPIYIVSMNETKQQAAIFSSKPLGDDKYRLDKISLRDAVLTSCSAPTFFPAVKLTTDKGDLLMSDGGTVANNPAHLIFQRERMNESTPHNYEIYSFGTGIVAPTATRGVDTGALKVGAILTNTLTAAEKLAYTQCIHEVKTADSHIDYLARINPKLDPGMDKMDDTSPAYTQYMIKKALSVTEGAAFADLVSRLGFKMPESQELEGIHTTIAQKLNALKTKKYSELNKYEKEFVLKKVLDLDFMFYQERLYQDPKTGNPMRMNDVEADAFLKEVTADIAKRKAERDGWLDYMWSFVTTDSHTNILEFIPRCMEFHKVSDNKITLTPAQLTQLREEKTILKKIPATYLSVEINYTQYDFSQNELLTLSPTTPIRGGKGSLLSGTEAPGSATSKLLLNLLRGFIECCDSIKDNTSGQSKYKDHKASYLDLAALIFWKDTLKDLEGTLTKGGLVKLKENLLNSFGQIMYSRAGLTQLTAETLRGSRYGVLVQGLDAYISKFFKNSAQNNGKTTLTNTSQVVSSNHKSN